MTVQLDKSLGGGALAESEFDMADFFYGEYKPVRVMLKQSEANTKYPIDPKGTYIDIGLKGSNEDGLVQKRMSAIKNKMSESIQQTMKEKLKAMASPKGDKAKLMSKFNLGSPKAVG